jgi:transcriptional regulator with GAF, ATPase, and Fis domain
VRDDLVTVRGDVPGVPDVPKVTQRVDTDSVTLITGETGVGKEVIARAIHNQSSRRRGRW